MNKIRFSCEQYAWVMAGCIKPEEPYYDRFGHISQVVGQSGFAGFEPIDKFLYSHYDAERLASALAGGKIELSSVVLLDDWLNPRETEAERVAADRLIELLARHFPKAVLMLCQMPTTRPDADAELKTRQDNLSACINEISRRAAGRGLKCSYHPNSPESSIWRTQSDYDRLLPMLDAKVLGWTPDVGHMAICGMDPRNMMRDYRSLVNHVHYKDMSAKLDWALMGEGVIDFTGITQDLVASGYQGWIVVEDECERAVHEPDKVTQECGDYVSRVLKPIVAKQACHS